MDIGKKTKRVAKIVKPRTTLKRKRSSEYDIQLEKPISPTEITREKIAGQWVTHKQCAYMSNEYMSNDYYAIFFNSGVNLSSTMPILDQDDNLEDGIYTWVILSLNDDDDDVENKKPRMYLKKTLSSYEFGTKHQEILYHITCKHMQCEKYKLYYAGELLKTGNTIKFNLESGTYMKDKLNPKKITMGTIKMSKITAGEMINERLNKTGELTIEEENDTFITHESIPLTENDLKIYNFFGAKIYKFNDEAKCKIFAQRGNKKSLSELNGERVQLSSLNSGGKRKGTKRKGTKRKGTKRKGTKRKGTKRKQKRV